ncbi:MAG: NIF family HAD-type phosphatase [bacterium]
MIRRVIALDLEGTLISNAISVFPRPGLYEFLEFCRRHFERVVVMTAVSEHRFRQVAALLASEGSVPEWFRDIDYVVWEGPYKDLRCIPNFRVEEILLVDDIPSFVHPDQADSYLPIQSWEAPYLQEDQQLGTLKEHILKKLNCGVQRS